jgi:NAD(P)-dependent dehydrogenase (short-subunit alcohol dehydrogenase family)
VKEVNLKGSYIMTHYFIQSQPNPKEPTGTIITVSSGRAGLTGAGGSAYNIAKIAEQRLNEHLQLGQYPSPPNPESL